MASNGTASTTDVSQLEEDLTIERTILQSLYETPSTAEVQRAIEGQKVKVAKLQKRLGEARRGQSNAHNHHDRPPTSSNPSAMSSPDNSRAGTPSNHRKRSFGSSHLGISFGGRPEIKSRKPTPTPSRNGDLFDDPFAGAEVIDLTGDDDEWKAVLERQKEAAERARRNKMVADADRRYAASMSDRNEHGGLPTQHSSSFSQSSQQNRNDAFSRIMSRPSQYGGVKPEPGLNAFGTSPARPGVKAEPSSSQVVRFGQSSTLGVRGIKGEGYSNLSSGGIKPEDTFSLTSGRVKTEQKPSSNGFTATPAYRPLSENNESKYHMPGSFNFDDDEEIFSYGSFQQPANPSRPGLSSQMALPQRPAQPSFSQPPTLPSIHQLSAGSNIEQARQAALASHGVTHPNSVYAPYGSYLQPAASFSTPLPGFSRPGYLQNGSYMAPGLSSNGSLSSIINRTNSYDFDSFTDSSGNRLNSSLVNLLTDYVEDPRKTEEEIQNLLANIRPDMDIPAEERGETPDALRYPLYPHQQLALKWMKDMEKGTNKGGILADDMGLGKTISTLSLMVTEQSDDTVKTNLIIGPVALIKQWESEIKKKLKSTHKMSVFLLHMKKKVTYQEMKRYDVVLTTYGSIASEWKRYQLHIDQRKQSPAYSPADDLALQSLCPLLHPRSKFYRIILDEAQCIKNGNTQQSKGVHMIDATYRWCLTGTPMMNGVQELYPLIRFLRIRPYCSQKQFTEAFKSLFPKAKDINGQKAEAMRKLQAVLKAMMLRRMKNSMIDGKPILTLPPKTQVDDHVVFSDDEQKFYQDLEGRSQVQFNKYLRQGTIGKNYSSILVLLLRLRQACCHPHLMDFECVSSNEVSEDQMLALAKTLEQTVIDRIKQIEGFECPICYEPVPDPTLIIPCGHDTCSECFASLTDQAAQGNIRSGNENGAAKCPVCRGAVDPAKTINYTSFQKAHMPEKVPPPAPAPAEDSETESGTESETEDDSSDTDSVGSLRDFIVDDDNVELEGGDARAEVKAESAAAARIKQEKKEKKEKKLAQRMAKAAKAQAKAAAKKAQEEVKPAQLANLRKEAGKNKEARRRYMHYLRDNWEDSAKVTRVVELLKTIQETNEKTIIFSQWTSLLDLIECAIKYKLGLRYCRYTGGMSRNDRDKSVTEFVSNPHNTIMLVSLRAGNAGLNLTVASHVIICDPFWNPYIEMQAVDRAHRIGQQREVKIHRILVKETVEDRILKIQEDKRQLVEAALDEGEAKNLGRLNLNELRYLFGFQGRR